METPTPTPDVVDFVEMLGPEYAKKMLRGRRKPWTAKIRKPVLDFVDLLATIATEAQGYRVWRNDIIETMVAFFAEHPEILDQYLTWAWNIGILPESEEEEPIFEVKLIPVGKDQETGLDIANAYLEVKKEKS